MRAHQQPCPERSPRGAFLCALPRGHAGAHAMQAPRAEPAEPWPFRSTETVCAALLLAFYFGVLVGFALAAVTWA